MSLPSIDFLYTLQFPRCKPRQDFKLKVIAARPKVNSKSHHDIAHLHPQSPNQCLYQVSTSYTLQFLRYSPDTILKSRSLQQSQCSNQGYTMTLHIYTPNQSPFYVSSSYTLPILRYSPDKIFPTAQTPNQMRWVKNHTCTACKGCQVKTKPLVRYQKTFKKVKRAQRWPL